MYHGMQDWNYAYHGVFGITLELSERKWPYASTLDRYWADNRDALLAYIRVPLHNGIRGHVSKHGRNDTFVARISVTDVATDTKLVDVRSDPATNAYHRLLPPGQFVVTASADGCAPRQTTVHITADQSEPTAVLFEFSECVL